MQLLELDKLFSVRNSLNVLVGSYSGKKYFLLLSDHYLCFWFTGLFLK